MKKIEFIAPRDIKKGESFSFEELFDTDINMVNFEKATSELLEHKTSKEVEIRLKSERELLEKEKEILNKSFVEMKEKYISESKEMLEREIIVATKEAESKLKDQLLEAKTKAALSDEYKNLLSQKENAFENLKKAYDQILESKLEELREKHKVELEEKIREIDAKQMSNAVIGDDAEEFVRNELKSAWPEDNISKPNHATGGADVLHEIEINGKVISKIYYEVKNRKAWSKANYDNFVDKVRNEDHDFNIFISSALPKSSREQHIKYFNEDFMYDEINNVYLLKFNNWLPVVSALRLQAIRVNQIEGTLDRKEDIKQKVYDFFMSPEFKNYYSRVNNNVSKTIDHFNEIKSTANKGISEATKAKDELDNLNIELEAKFK